MVLNPGCTFRIIWGSYHFNGAKTLGPTQRPRHLIDLWVGSGHQYFLFGLFLINLFIYLFLAALGLCRWVFVAAPGLSLVAASKGYSSLWCVGFLLQWLLLFQSTGSRCVGFSSCGTRAQ